MDNFDEVDLNHLLDLVQNHISHFRGWSLEERIFVEDTLGVFVALEAKILKMLDGV